MEDSVHYEAGLGDDDWALETNFNTYILPDSVLLEIFQYLSPRELLNAGQTCKAWRQVSRDELLWKRLLYLNFKIDPSVGILPGKCSWLSEYKRLTYHTPWLQTEVLRDHSNQVLHVSFAHNGTMFATCSKDGYILVWSASHPAELKYYHDMKRYQWKYTQFSQFNQSDTLLLVSGVHFGTPHSTSGEIIVFSLQDGFTLQCRVMNKPYDIFGTWYSDQYFLSGDLTWLAHLVSCSILTLNRASQESQSEHTPILDHLYRFYNRNASTVRAVTVARCLAPPVAATTHAAPSGSGDKEEQARSKGQSGNPPSHRDISSPGNEQARLRPTTSRGEAGLAEGRCQHWKPQFDNSIQYNADYRVAEDRGDRCIDEDSDISDAGEEPDDVIESADKFLIYATASKTYSPHQVAFKRIKPIRFPKTLDLGLTIRERLAELEQRNLRERDRELLQLPRLEPNWLDYDEVAERFDEADHLIDLQGHIIGMGVSPDQRYLYVNSRPWPHGCDITNPLDPPPIAQEIDIHVIDLITLKEVGTMFRAHKAYTPNNECFFIFLDVSNEYIASGAEDKHGYLWDRHYGICLAKFPHTDVVNSVAFNPRDPEMLVTTSDDFTVRVWRSLSKVRQLGCESSGMAIRPR